MNLGIFFKKNASTILTGAGLVGIVATAVMSSYDHGKYVEECIKLNNRVTTMFADNIAYKVKNSPSKKEKAIVFAKSYWRTAIIATATGACVIFSNRLDTKKIAALTAAAAFAEKKFDKYRDLIKEKLGEEEEKDIYSSTYNDLEVVTDLPKGSEDLYFYDTFTEKFFVANPEDVEHAIYNINRNFQLKTYAFFSDFYNLIGIKPIDLHKTIGWSHRQELEDGRMPWIDITCFKKVGGNGVDYYEIIYDPEPSFRAVEDKV